MLNKKRNRELNFFSENDLLEGYYLIETTLANSRVLESDDFSLRIKEEIKEKNNYKQYFYFQLSENNSYLIKYDDYVLGTGKIKDDDIYIVRKQINKNCDSQKWILTRIQNNEYTIMNKSLKKFLEISDEKAEIDSKVILSDINYQTFYLWPKELSNELHVVFPFENITSKMIKRKQYLKYIELSDYIILEKNNIFDFNHCIYLEKVKCCCEHLQYFKDVNLLEIIIQEGDTKIQKKDFETFTNLEAITLPKSLNEIEEGTFDNMYNLNNVNGELKWYKYFNISSLKIPEGEKIIRREIFYKFKSLKKVILPNTIEIIEVGAFEESGIEEIDIPNNVKIIPENAFKNCKNLKKIKIPNNVEYIYVTAFTNCNKLKEENIYVYDDELKKFLQKKLKIEKKIINKFDYWKYQSLEDLEISLDTIFESDDIRDIFFERLPFLKKVKMNPEFLKAKTIDIINLKEIIIPHGITNLESIIFEKCFSLEYLELPESIITIDEILISTINTNINIFGNCQNLRTVKLSEELINISQYIFYNCYNLFVIKNLEGETFRFRLKHEIEEGETNLNFRDLRKIKNLDTLIIPSTINNIIEDEADISENLQCIKGDPKWLFKFPSYQLKEFIIPNFVKKINEKYFEFTENLDTINFNGNIELAGNKCKNFEKVLNFKCGGKILGASDDLKNSKKIIEIDKNCKNIEEYSFKDWYGIEQLYLPNSLKRIERYAFFNCYNLYEINIPPSVEYIDETSFEGCSNIRKIICNGRFLNKFPSENVKIIHLTSDTQESDLQNLDNFSNLEVLEVPRHINNLIVNLPKLYKIKCSSKVLENFPINNKKNLQIIELYDDYLTNAILQNCDNVQNYIIPENYKIDIDKIKNVHKTTIDDIINYDKKNVKYKYYLENMINDINEDRLTIGYEPNDNLGELTILLTDICITIKKNNKMIPHPVQCFSMLRMLDEILDNNNNGALAEIQTGEGKSFIIAVISIALAKKGRKVDIVTSTLELAFRDENEQSKIYNLFGITSGVLCSKNSDKEYIDLYKPEYSKKKEDEKSSFYTHILTSDIIYSTNYNYQFLFLHSLFQPRKIRKREYDIVLIDEVDNMLLDQMTNPAIVGYSIKLYKYKEILKDIYNMRDSNENLMFKKLNEKYKNVSNLNLDIVKKCKKSAKISNQLQKDIDYIMEGKEVIIMDSNTGYKKPGQRWSKYIHEFCEIKENVNVKNPIASYCMINQNSYFNLYNKISGVTGTIGDLNDQEILKNNYKIEIFKVPRNIINPKKITQKKRPKDIYSLYQEVINEIHLEREKGRPILVIMDSPLHVDEFANLLNLHDLQFGKISGIDLKSDKDSIKIAGESRRITIATSAGGRGIDIKLNNDSIKAGGLHVIIPFCMPNERCENQAFGRSGRQGQPGSATIYRSENDRYILAQDFDKEDSKLIDLQYEFNNYIEEKWPWIYDFNPSVNYNATYEFNTSTDKVFLDLKDNFVVDLVSYIYGKNKNLIDTIYTSIIFSWSFFFNSLKWSDDIDIKNEYKKYLDTLHRWIPDKLKFKDCLSFYSKKFGIENIINELRNNINPKYKLKCYMMLIDPTLVANSIGEKVFEFVKEFFGFEINIKILKYEEEYFLTKNHSITISRNLSASVGIKQEKAFSINSSIFIEIKDSDIKLEPKLEALFSDTFLTAKIPFKDIKAKLFTIFGDTDLYLSVGCMKYSIIITRTDKCLFFSSSYSVILTQYLDPSNFKPPPPGFMYPAKVPAIPQYLRNLVDTAIGELQKAGGVVCTFVQENIGIIIFSVVCVALITVCVCAPEFAPLAGKLGSLYTICESMNRCYLNQLKPA